jgi:hypothetical protein
MVLFYEVILILWGVVGLLCMRRAAPATVLQVHRKLAWVPMVQVIYSASAFTASSTAGVFMDWHRSLLPTLAMALQFLSLVMTMEVPLYIAKAWGTTRPSLDRVEVIYVRALVVTWAATFIALKQLRVEHTALIVVSGALWFGIHVLTYYWASSNNSKLHYVLRASYTTF